MNDHQIQRIIDNFRHQELVGIELIETHISWVILSTHYAFKIKKPHTFSFLDFSKLELRKYYCERELMLNRRLAESMYLEVVTIREHENGLITIGADEGTIIDYALKMKRMDNSKQMNLMLEQLLVNPKQMYALAEDLAHFHQTTSKSITPPNKVVIQEDFADILSVIPFVKSQLGQSEADGLEQMVEKAYQFVEKHQHRFWERFKKGFYVDGHGDLHSKNIFLLEKPVIFDCIEFNDHFRQVDVLDELAFFCMDLDYYDSAHLANLFLQRYTQLYNCFEKKEDFQLFLYYKSYRANVRLKVNALKSMETTSDAQQIEVIRGYYRLLNQYFYNMEISDKPFLIH